MGSLLGTKRPRHDVGHSPARSVGAKNDWDVPLLPRRALWHAGGQLDLSCSPAHHYLTPSAIRMHTVTSHPQLFVYTPLPHTLTYSHAHHCLTLSAVRMHTFTSHSIHLRPTLDQMFSLRHFRLQICTCLLYFLTKILPALCLTCVYIQQFLYFF
jgi:hypothetical protein